MITCNRGKAIHLKGLDFTLEEMKASRERNGLLRIGIAIGHGGKKRECNSNCPYCFEDRNSDIEPFSIEKINSIIHEAKQLGAKTVVIIGYGEPLLPSRLKETFSILEAINNNKLTSVLFTNGMSITKEIAQQLYKLNTTIITKLNSLDPLVQDYLTKTKDSLKRMKESLNILIETGFNKSNPTRLGLQTGIFHENLKDIPKLAKLCVENNIFPYFESIKFTGELQKNPSLYVNKEQIKTVFESIVKQYPNLFGTNGNFFLPQGRCCLQHYYGSLFITPEGIFPCSAINYRIGEINKDRLKDLLNHKVIQGLRKLPDFIEGKCKECKYITDTQSTLPKCYGGCRGNTFSLTSNIFSEDPLCWRN